MALANPMTYQDIVAIAKPRIVQLSPDGNRLAYVTRTGDITTNKNRDTLFVGQTCDPLFERTTDSDEILKLLWRKDSAALYLLSRHAKSYEISSYVGNKKTSIVKLEQKIYDFTVSRQRNLVFYTTVDKTSPEKLTNLEDYGYVFDWNHDHPSIVTESFARAEFEKLWAADLASQQTRLVTSIPRGSYSGGHLDNNRSIESMHVSDDSSKLLLSLNRFGDPDKGETPFSSDVAVFDLANQKWAYPISPTNTRREQAIWVSNDQVVYQTVSGTFKCGLHVLDVATKSVSDLPSSPDRCFDQLAWDNEKRLLYGVGKDILYRRELVGKNIKEVNLPKNFQLGSFDHNFEHAAFVTQSSNIPPEIAFIELASDKLRRLTNLNPQLASIDHGYVERIDEKTSNGLRIDGYLVHPTSKKENVRYPIIIATYGFHGDYIADAEWHSSFPAQTLAAQGYYILLLNKHGFGQGVADNPKKAQEAEFGQILPVFEEAVDLVVKKGGDSQKVGIYGWSHGGFIVNYLITHSSKFHVAALGEGGDYMPGEFWLGGVHWQKIFVNIFGGPPWGDSLKNYLAFSPFYHLAKVKTPLLLEFVKEAGLMGFEMYSPLRYLGVPAELVLYQGEDHNFVKPRSRVGSMARKTDWFNFWLKNEKDPNPAKAEQYKRWEDMKKAKVVP